MRNGSVGRLSDLQLSQSPCQLASTPSVVNQEVELSASVLRDLRGRNLKGIFNTKFIVVESNVTDSHRGPSHRSRLPQ